MEKTYKKYNQNFYMIETEERLETIQLLEEAKPICGTGESGELNPGEKTHEETSIPI